MKRGADKSSEVKLPVFKGSDPLEAAIAIGVIHFAISADSIWAGGLQVIQLTAFCGHPIRAELLRYSRESPQIEFLLGGMQLYLQLLHK